MANAAIAVLTVDNNFISGVSLVENLRGLMTMMYAFNHQPSTLAERPQRRSQNPNLDYR